MLRTEGAVSIIDSATLEDVAARPASVLTTIVVSPLAVGVSETADFGDADCPANPRCADILTDPAHWGTNMYGIGGDESLRLFMTTLPYPAGDHLFAVGWQGDTAADMRAFGVLTQPILDSIRVPDR